MPVFVCCSCSLETTGRYEPDAPADLPPEGLPAPTTDVNGGGGGGAAGRIRVNARAGDMSVTGTVSPSATAVFSLGELAAG